LKINIFKNMDLWKFLSFFNNEITRRWEQSIEKMPNPDYIPGVEFPKHDPITLKWKGGNRITNPCQIWFNPKNIQQVPFPRHYPEIIPLNYDKKFLVNENRCCYLGMFLINLLYADRKNVLIEDRACGMAKFSFLLAQLGFSNFSLIDDLSQVGISGIENMMKGIPYKLNTFDKPVIINQSGWPNPMEDRPIDDAELICFYNNARLIDWANEHLTFLCEDSDGLARAYCRADKLTEFQDKIREYEVKE